jgi:hypothetical protein
MFPQQQEWHYQSLVKQLLSMAQQLLHHPMHMQAHRGQQAVIDDGKPKHPSMKQSTTVVEVVLLYREVPAPAVIYSTSS